MNSGRNHFLGDSNLGMWFSSDLFCCPERAALICIWSQSNTAFLQINCFPPSLCRPVKNLEIFKGWVLSMRFNIREVVAWVLRWNSERSVEKYIIRLIADVMCAVMTAYSLSSCGQTILRLKNHANEPSEQGFFFFFSFSFFFCERM